ncbi:hypothetical protein TrLO_g15928 [Triparma laevis f. longispina]|uniref:Lysophospholipase n=1 Tax=Triparma laevis f. longispina TaxID=1714387 RepID=A0A9W7E0Z2_9STRA|nr:hypothetical protein TrLO_g15928 [Triparma laevis f. longispina]
MLSPSQFTLLIGLSLFMLVKGKNIFTAKLYPEATDNTPSFTTNQEDGYKTEERLELLKIIQEVISESKSDNLLDSLSVNLLQNILDYNSNLERKPSTSKNKGIFPEFEVIERYASNKTNSGIAYSGGGSRAYVCAVGYTSGLLKLGLLKNVKYVGGISGGNWFVNSYSYRNSDLTTEEYVGEILGPEDNTFINLNIMEKGCMRSFVRNPCILDILGSFLNGTTPMNSWVDGIYETYLEPGNIKRHAPFAYDLIEATRIASSNNMDPSDFNIVNDPINDPFPLVGVALVGPVSQAPFQVRSRDMVMLDVSPVATGVSNRQNIDYKSRDDNRGTLTAQVGGFIESTFFGSNFLKNNDDGTAELEEGKYGLWTIEQAAAASSMAPEEFFSLTSNRIADYVGFHAPYFSPNPSTSTSTPSTTDFLVADGGDLENVNLIQMLLRGVENIVLFMDFEIPLAGRNTYNPFTHLPKFSDVEDIPSYFGIPHIPETVEDIFDWLGQDFGRNKVFKSWHYPFVIDKLQKAQAKGKGAVATVELETVDNEWWGVKGGDTVSVTFVYLSKATQFEEDLPENVRTEATTGTSDPTDLTTDGKFKGFPHYPTGAAEITHEQSNLLANFCGWIIEQNEDVFRKALS